MYCKTNVTIISPKHTFSHISTPVRNAQPYWGKHKTVGIKVVEPRSALFLTTPGEKRVFQLSSSSDKSSISLPGRILFLSSSDSASTLRRWR